MKKSITIPSILQSVLTPEEVALVVQTIGYKDRARYAAKSPQIHLSSGI
ncbi:hypothetical protein [Paenibacillus selenitireducens]|nr:hypothetical protein [Paenibacillus selenitireducens]